MNNTVITINSEEAETILFALAMRSRQKGLHPQGQKDAVEVGRHLEHKFVERFGWDAKIDRMKLNRSKIKSVSIKAFDLAPTDA